MKINKIKKWNENKEDKIRWNKNKIKRYNKNVPKIN